MDYLNYIAKTHGCNLTDPSTFQVMVDKLISECPVDVKSDVGEDGGIGTSQASPLVSQAADLISEKSVDVKFEVSEDGGIGTDYTATGANGGRVPLSKTPRPYASNRGRSDLKFECEQCGKRLPWTQRLNHIRTHTGDRPFKCANCSKSFSQMSYMKAHQRRVHCKILEFPCKVCEKRFHSKAEVMAHSWRHAEENPGNKSVRREKCKQCEKKFATIASLRNHMLLHSGEKPFECPSCPEKFVRRAQMTDHCRRVHEKRQGNFECNMCEKGFLAGRDLTCHLRTHSGEKPFTCDLCDYATVRIQSLREHKIYKHTHAYTHYCGKCKKGYVKKSDKLIHERKCEGVCS